MSEDRLYWTSASRTHVGRVRKLNEDACLELPEQGLWAVADGMGGHAAGDLASRMVVDSLQKISHTSSLEDLTVNVRHILKEVNRRLTEEASRRQQHIIGCTVAALLIHDRQCVCLWAGDSRIYLFRDNHLRQLTRDHSQVEELISRGLIRRDQAKAFPGSNAITRAVGVLESVELDTEILNVLEGDTFLLCSDGLYNEVSQQDIEHIMALDNCQAAADRLIQSALEGKARDNISVVLVRIEEDQITKTMFNPSATRLDQSAEDDDKTTINR